MTGEGSSNPVQDSLNTEFDTQESGSVKRRRTSDVWQHFIDLGICPDGKKRVRCKYCNKAYVIGSTNCGTSTLNRHVNSCKQRPQFNNLRDMFIDQDRRIRAKQIDQLQVQNKIAMCIIKHDLPFSFVEYEAVRDLLIYLNDDVKHITRNTACADVLRLYGLQKEKLKNQLRSIPSRICLTSDSWSSCTTEGYICLTAHFVDEKWKLNSKILSFCSMPPPHSGIELARKVYACLQDWGIEKKVFSLTLDNASANDNMQDILKKQLSVHNNLLCEGDFFHVRCCAHVLNLIVHEGLKVTGDALHKIRESVKYVKGSEGRMKLFEDCVRMVAVDIDSSGGLGLCMDVSTRWNSTYMMLESAIKYERAFNNLRLVEENYKYCPSPEEWSRGRKMCDFLRPFFDITNMISGSTYPTSNLYFTQVWKIECRLKDNMMNEDDVISDMARRMHVKFTKYWDDYSVILAMGTVLDPRMKFVVLSHCYEKLDPNTCEEKLEYVKQKLYQLFGQYKTKPVRPATDSDSIPSTSTVTRTTTTTEPFLFDEFVDIEKTETERDMGRSSLDAYLEDRKLEMKHYRDMDVLEYWKVNKERYGELSTMACDVLSIPITTVASESAFSIGSRVLNKYRSRLLPKHVQALICTRNWLLGFAQPDPEEKCDYDDADARVPEGAQNLVNSNNEYEITDD